MTKLNSLVAYKIRSSDKRLKCRAIVVATKLNSTKEKEIITESYVVNVIFN